VYSLTTTRGQQKGGVADVPAGLVDGKQQLAATDDLYGAGMAGILAGTHKDKDEDKLSMAWFDNLVIKAAGGNLLAPSRAMKDQQPLYPAQKSMPSGKN